MPEGLSGSKEKKWISKIIERFEKHQRKLKLNDKYLEKRAKEINKKYFGGKLKIKSVTFSMNQNTIFGSCTPDKGTIRLSHKARNMPKWVLDYLIIHELAHLIYHNHSKAFWKLVNKYPYAERAKGFLIAKGMEEDAKKSNA